MYQDFLNWSIDELNVFLNTRRDGAPIIAYLYTISLFCLDSMHKNKDKRMVMDAHTKKTVMILLANNTYEINSQQIIDPQS